MAEQLPFDLGHRAAYAREDFWVSDSNRAAVAWIDRWPEWPRHCLIVHGPAGCGKTHLGHVLTQATQGRATIVENIDTLLAAPGAQENLFHLLNRADAAHPVLMTSTLPPAGLDVALADLQSRLLAAPAVAVGAPDEQLMAVVMAKLFSDRQIYVTQDVVQFILLRSERSFAALRALVEALDRAALAQKRRVTVPLVREVMQGMAAAELPPSG